MNICIAVVCVICANFIFGLFVFNFILSITDRDHANKIISWLTGEITGDKIADTLIRVVFLSCWPGFLIIFKKSIR